MATAQAPIQKRLISVDEYELMGRAGVFPPDERLELIEGEIIRMAPIGSKHSGHVNRLNRILMMAVGDRAIVSVQNPIRTLRSEPVPDLVLLRPRADDYTSRVPGPEDVLLLIEVSDSTLEFDRSVKLPVYSAAGVSEVWIVNLRESSIEVYRKPTASGFGERQTMTGEAILTIGEMHEISVDLAQVLAD